mgnify:CR=1 FL=1
MTCLTRPTPVSLLSCRLPYSIQSGFYIKKYEITLLKSNPQKICHSYRLIFAPFAVQFNYAFIAKGQVIRRTNITIQKIANVLKSLLIRVTLRLKLPILILKLFSTTSWICKVFKLCKTFLQVIRIYCWVVGLFTLRITNHWIYWPSHACFLQLLYRLYVVLHCYYEMERTNLSHKRKKVSLQHD